MKVLQVIGGLDPAGGGPASAVTSLNKYLNRKGIDSVIWTTCSGYGNGLGLPLGEVVSFKGGKAVFWPYPESPTLKQFRVLYHSGIFARRYFINLFRVMKEYDIVHIHGFFSFVDLFASAFARFHKVPYIIAPRGSLINSLIEMKSTASKRSFLALGGRAVLEKADAVHCLTAYERDELERMGMKIRKYCLIPNGLDEDNFKEIPPRGELLRKYPRLTGKVKLLFLSRINFKKGLDTLIPAVASLREFLPNIHLLIVGNDDEGYMSEVSALINTYKVDECVTYFGPAYGKEKLIFFRDSDIFVLPSYSENFGLVLIEAMFMKLPVVITEAVGIASDIEAAGAGVIVEKTVDAVKDGILRLVKDPEMAREMGEKGRALVQSRFSWHDIADTLITVYQEIISTRKADDNPGNPRRAHWKP